MYAKTKELGSVVGAGGVFRADRWGREHMPDMPPRSANVIACVPYTGPFALYFVKRTSETAQADIVFSWSVLCIYSINVAWMCVSLSHYIISSSVPSNINYTTTT